MKHILFILSFLLLSSTVIGNSHKGETLYLWKTSSGEVWKGFGDKKIHSVYKGDVKNGEPNGLGYLIFPDGDKYVGSWKNGKRNGKGTHTYSYGRKYVGSWKDGWKNGQGKVSWTSGGYYEGSFKDGTFWTGTTYDKDGNIVYKLVNNMMINQ